MRSFGNIDELRMQTRVVAAATGRDGRRHRDLGSTPADAFEVLQEARERFYPVECYLLDLCLVIPEASRGHKPPEEFDESKNSGDLRPRLALDDPLLKLVESGQSASFIVSGADLTKIAEQQPELMPPLRDAVAAQRITIVGGELRDWPLPLLPLESALGAFAKVARRIRPR